LVFIEKRGRHGVTAVEIGVEMMIGRRNGYRTRATLERMGLEMGVALARDKLVVPTRNNRFMLARFAAKSVPPAVRVEDMPAPGFMRVGR
jgi:hypothetical protein